MATRKLPKQKANRERLGRALNEQETEIITLFQRLPEERRKLVLKLVKALKADYEVPGRPLLTWLDSLSTDDPQYAEKVAQRLGRLRS